MLRSIKALNGFKLGARDGELGKVKDFYFDDTAWTVRYLVAETGTWLSGRQVLISPHAVLRIHDRPEKVVDVNLTKEQVEHSPPIESDKPVSRQFEVAYYDYYSWPVYWGGPWDWGAIPYPGSLETGTPPPVPAPTFRRAKGDPHLRSSSELLCYSIQALNDLFGHVADLILDDEPWAIRYFVVDTRNWWPGKKVLLPQQWIAWVSWPEARVYVDLDRDTVKGAPEYNPSVPLTRDYETSLFNYYGREPYWSREPALAEAHWP
jgi:hypothetical protein